MSGEAMLPPQTMTTNGASGGAVSGRHAAILPV
eukprot:CAMPEP_0198355288 /NCGR_PEP_ID=MMETSP1450-20131203/118525_1 /TAXON_ID=753684 ORGANISM="Madagascaria erythrocladiodes, Strain CCMP3234" /NCGR_SAMPLE_ID=MMETSP1450 /ASSEMBLY_ACC=CAM_ASM_001115 /LENGTH=32 /DNA_ID= /DNA_START= /DNA_END= /DNA_ORIENTATION=